MATAKRKTKTSAKTARVHATRSAYKASAKPQMAWTQPGAAEAFKQTADLYKMPFNAEGVKQASEQATASANEMLQNMQNMFKPEAMKNYWNSDQAEQLRSFFNPEAMKQQWSEMFAKFNPQNAQSGFQASFQDFGRESAEQMNRSATQAAQFMHELQDLTRENVSALSGAGNQFVSITKEIGAEAINYANRGFAQQVELSKQIMGCRTLNELFDWAGKVMKVSLDGYFTQSVDMSEKLFEAMNAISDPLNERISDSTERLSRCLRA